MPTKVLPTPLPGRLHRINAPTGAHTTQSIDANFPTTLLGKWVRQREEFTWEEAVRTMTGLPAATIVASERAVERHAGRPLAALHALAGRAAHALGVIAEARQHAVAIEESSAGLDEVLESARRAVAEEHEIGLAALILVRPGGVPRTTSGKVQRQLCRQRFLDGLLEPVAAWRSGEAPPGDALAPPPSGFSGPEAVRYDPDQDVYFVANFNGGGNDLDDNGFISRVDPEGRIVSWNEGAERLFGDFAPALVGWAAVTGTLAMPAWILFALVTLWTPTHFWALAVGSGPVAGGAEAGDGEVAVGKYGRPDAAQDLRHEVPAGERRPAADSLGGGGVPKGGGAAARQQQQGTEAGGGYLDELPARVSRGFHGTR